MMCVPALSGIKPGDCCSMLSNYNVEYLLGVSWARLGPGYITPLTPVNS